MKKLAFLAAMILLSAANAIAQPEAPEAEKEKTPGQRLGVRLGYAQTPSDLHESFGGGFSIDLHWVQRVKHPLYVDVSMGTFYLGDLKRTVTGGCEILASEESMQIVLFTVTPVLEWPIGGRISLYAGGGVGMYTVALSSDFGGFTGEFTNTHFGVNGGVGLFYRFAEKWYLDLDLRAHKFWTGDHPCDLFLYYSEGDRHPLFYQGNVGVMLLL